jgi:hypothetical protein
MEMETETELQSPLKKQRAMMRVKKRKSDSHVL